MIGDKETGGRKGKKVGKEEREGGGGGNWGKLFYPQWQGNLFKKMLECRERVVQASSREELCKLKE